MDYSRPGSSVHGILQARILEWVSISFFRGSSYPRDGTPVTSFGRWILYRWATREALLVFRKHLIKIRSCSGMPRSNKKVWTTDTSSNHSSWEMLPPSPSMVHGQAAGHLGESLHPFDLPVSSRCGSSLDLLAAVLHPFSLCFNIPVVTTATLLS